MRTLYDRNCKLMSWKGNTAKARERNKGNDKKETSLLTTVMHDWWFHSLQNKCCHDTTADVTVFFLNSKYGNLRWCVAINIFFGNRNPLFSLKNFDAFLFFSKDSKFEDLVRRGKGALSEWIYCIFCVKILKRTLCTSAIVNFVFYHNTEL